jgi:hypothetical protein
MMLTELKNLLEGKALTAIDPEIRKRIREDTTQTKPWMILQRLVVLNGGYPSWRIKWHRSKVCSLSDYRRKGKINEAIKVSIQTKVRS